MDIALTGWSGILDKGRELDIVPGHQDVRMLALCLVGSLGAPGWMHDYEGQVRFLARELRQTADKLESEVIEHETVN